MPDPSNDERFLSWAIDLARQGFGLASPNPHVGAVIVDPQGKIVGTGTYTYEGVRHAEVLALEQAGEKARGGTLYINLEPHSHQGRTPPCTDALIAAGIGRVVASMADPNPKVSGRGFERLRAAGIAVEVGGLEAEARRINEAFARYVLHGIPLVTLKAAMTLDGKIAPPPAAGSSHTPGIPAGGWITSEAARANVQLQRYRSDAILAGIGTILADDPLLTDRSGCERRRRLLRVVLDSRLRIPLESRIVQSASKSDVLVFCSSAEDRKKGELQARGVQVDQIASDTYGRTDIQAILQHLGKREITSVMIEGGAAVNGMALSAGIIDKVLLYYAPKIMAAEGAIPFATGPHLGAVNQIPQLRQLQLHRFGDDFAVEGYLRDPYEA